MGRTPMIAGNWKMYKTPGEAVALVQQIDNLIGDEPESFSAAEPVVCPPFVALKSVATALEFDKSPVKLAAQNVHWESQGAYTGEVSPPMLVDIGVDYCVVGHSERRQYFGETNESVNQKVRALFAAGIVPIMCCGESLETRDAGETERFVREQIRVGLEGLDEQQAGTIVIAYEPIWAIGTGLTPTPEAANDVCRTIRATVGALFGQPAAIRVRILYGGSVKPENIALFMPEPDIDGALIGGAALEAESFISMVRVGAQYAE